MIIITPYMGMLQSCTFSTSLCGSPVIATVEIHRTAKDTTAVTLRFDYKRHHVVMRLDPLVMGQRTHDFLLSIAAHHEGRFGYVEDYQIVANEDQRYDAVFQLSKDVMTALNAILMQDDTIGYAVWYIHQHKAPQHRYPSLVTRIACMLIIENNLSSSVTYYPLIGFPGVEEPPSEDSDTE